MSFRIQKIAHSRNEGFTIVETLVAVTILTLVIIGPMNIAARGLNMGLYANDEMTAVFLAQEGIEAIQKLRDDDALLALYPANPASPTAGEDNPWSWFSASALGDCKTSDGCDVDISDYSFQDCSTASNCVLQYDTNLNSSDTLYSYSSGADFEDSIYSRKITIGALDNGGVPVTVTVTWENLPLFGGNRTITLQTWIYDIYNHYDPIP